MITFIIEVKRFSHIITRITLQNINSTDRYYMCQNSQLRLLVIISCLNARNVSSTIREL